METIPEIFDAAEISIEFQSNPALVQDALGQIIAGLQPLELTQDQSGTLELVLAEVVNNVIEHAYSEETGHPVNIAVYGSKEAINCQVIDCGKAMPHNQLPRGALHNLNVDLDDLPEGGFGWFLIGELTKNIKYMRTGGKNYLSFSMNIG